MSGARGSSRRSWIDAILTMLIMIGLTAWFIGGCSQQPEKPAEATAEKKDGDVHVKVDLPDTITIKP